MILKTPLLATLQNRISKAYLLDFDTTSNRLGNTVADKNSRLAAVLKGVAELDFGDFEDNHIDLFGDAYEFLISNYAANAGNRVASSLHHNAFPS